MTENEKRNRLVDLLRPREGQSDADSGYAWIPLGDVKESRTSITVYIDLPGIDEDELTIGCDNGTLLVFGERDFDHDNEDAEEYSVIDRPYGRFRYRVAVDGALDTLNITAKYKRGVLKIRIPKATPRLEANRP